MIHLIRTNSHNPDFAVLVTELDQELAERNGAEQAFYTQFNKIDLMKEVIVAYWNDVPAGCGALKPFGENESEVKRMFTRPGYRGKGIAKAILGDLERWAAELGCTGCVLETGVLQAEAQGLYLKSGYQRIPNYGQYIGIEKSLCFRKQLA